MMNRSYTLTTTVGLFACFAFCDGIPTSQPVETTVRKHLRDFGKALRGDQPPDPARFFTGNSLKLGEQLIALARKALEFERVLISKHGANSASEFKSTPLADPRIAFDLNPWTFDDTACDLAVIEDVAKDEWLVYDPNEPNNRTVVQLTPQGVLFAPSSFFQNDDEELVVIASIKRTGAIFDKGIEMLNAGHDLKQVKQAMYEKMTRPEK